MERCIIKEQKRVGTRISDVFFYFFFLLWMATRARSNKVSLFSVFMIYDIFMDVARKYLSDNKESPRFFFFLGRLYVNTHKCICEAKGESE